MVWMVKCKNISVVFVRVDLMCGALGRRRSKGTEPTKALGGWGVGGREGCNNAIRWLGCNNGKTASFDANHLFSKVQSHCVTHTGHGRILDIACFGQQLSYVAIYRSCVMETRVWEEKRC